MQTTIVGCALCATLLAVIVTHSGDDRRCARGAGCVDREREDTDDGTLRWVGALLTKSEGMCGPCITRTGHTIGYLVADVVELTTLIGAQLQQSLAGFVRSSNDLRAPIRLAVETLRSEIDFELQYWAEVVAAELGIDWDSTKTERSRIAVRVQRAARLLMYQVGTLIKLPMQERCAWSADGEPLRDLYGDREITECSGLDGALRLLELHHRVYCIAGRTKLVHRLTPACPWCDQRTLVRCNGSDMVECENCDKRIDEMHYNWFARITLAEEKRRQEEAAAAEEKRRQEEAAAA